MHTPGIFDIIFIEQIKIISTAIILIVSLKIDVGMIRRRKSVLLFPRFLFIAKYIERTKKKMVKGVVKKYIQEKGYGFIAGDDGKSVFVHQSNIKMDGYRFLEEGQVVAFDLEQNEKGYNALNVEVRKGV